MAGVRNDDLVVGTATHGNAGPGRLGDHSSSHCLSLWAPVSSLSGWFELDVGGPDLARSSEGDAEEQVDGVGWDVGFEVLTGPVGAAVQAELLAGLRRPGPGRVDDPQVEAGFVGGVGGLEVGGQLDAAAAVGVGQDALP